jgi:hypothetical protein
MEHCKTRHSSSQRCASVARSRAVRAVQHVCAIFVDITRIRYVFLLRFEPLLCRDDPTYLNI